MLVVTLAAAGVAVFPALAEAACNPPVIGAAEFDIDPLDYRSATTLRITYHDQCGAEQQTRVYVADAINGGGWQLIETDGYNSGGWRQATASGLEPGGRYCFEVEVDGSDGVTRRSQRFCTFTNPAFSYYSGQNDDYYDVMLSWRDIEVISTSETSSSARWEAVERLDLMVGGRVDLQARLRQHGAYVVVLDVAEAILGLPECQDPDTNCTDRRGAGGVLDRPMTVVGEENLLNLPEDDEYNEDIFVHEFGHTVLNLTAPADLRAAVDACYISAKQQNLWDDTYADDTIDEYWATATQAWFDVGAPASAGLTNGIQTREQLRDYDRCIYDLVTYTYESDHARTYLDPADPSKDLHLWQYDSGRLTVTGGRSDGLYGAYAWEWNGSSWGAATWLGWHAGASALNAALDNRTFASRFQIKLYRNAGGSSKAMLPAPGEAAPGASDRVIFTPAE